MSTWVKLIDLAPQFFINGGEGVSRPSNKRCGICGGAGCDTCHSTGWEYEPAPLRTGVGLSFLCPCVNCVSKRTGSVDTDFYLRHFVSFKNPLDGEEPVGGEPFWQRTGETFETLVLSPSILSVKGKGGCGWHGYVGGSGGQRPGWVETL